MIYGDCHRNSSIVAATSCAADVTAIYRYDEYGVPAATNASVSSGGRFGYTGQIWIPELGLWYYKARMYCPECGRFMQVDPVGYEGGQVNLYAYVGNDPIGLRDPSGKCGAILDNGVRAACEIARTNQIQAAADYISTADVSPGQLEQGYYSTFNELTGEISDYAGAEAGIGTTSDFDFTGPIGGDLTVSPSGQLMTDGIGTFEHLLVSSHSHPGELGEGGGMPDDISLEIDAANETLSPTDQNVLRAAPVVLKTPTGEIKVFSGACPVQEGGCPTTPSPPKPE